MMTNLSLSVVPLPKCLFLQPLGLESWVGVHPLGVGRAQADKLRLYNCFINDIFWIQYVLSSGCWGLFFPVCVWEGEHVENGGVGLAVCGWQHRSSMSLVMQMWSSARELGWKQMSASTGVRWASAAVPCGLRCGAYPGSSTSEWKTQGLHCGGHSSSSASLAGHSVVSLKDTAIIRHNLVLWFFFYFIYYY